MGQGKTGKNGIGKKVRNLNEYDIIYMQALRSYGMPVREIAEKCGVSEKTVYIRTEDLCIPEYEYNDLVVIVKGMLLKSLLDAHKERDPEKAREHALTIEKYFKSLRDAVDLQDALSIRDQIYALRDVIDHFVKKGSCTLEDLKEYYEKKKEELLQ